jgi:hypothetical protein
VSDPDLVPPIPSFKTMDSSGRFRRLSSRVPDRALPQPVQPPGDGPLHTAGLWRWLNPTRTTTSITVTNRTSGHPLSQGEVRLTPTEWHLVEVLVRNRGKLVGQRQLLREVWGPHYGEETNYLRVFIARVRRKLEPDPAVPRYFLTEPGMGYRFETADD